MDAERKQRLRQSLKNFRRLLDLEPGHVGHLEQLARLSVELGQSKDAARYLLDRAQSLESQGQVAAALADCESALRLCPGDKKARKLAERLRPNVALVLTAQAARDEPQPIFDLLPEAPPERVTDMPLALGPLLGDPPPEPAPAVDLPGRVVQVLGVAPARPGDEPVDASTLLAVHDVDELDAEEIQSLPAVDAASLLDDDSTAPPPAAPPVFDDHATMELDPDEELEAYDTSEAPLYVEHEVLTADIELAEELGPTPARVQERPTDWSLQPVLPEAPLLSTLSRADLGELVAGAVARRCAPGSRVVGRGAPVESLLLVMRGHVTLGLEGRVHGHAAAGQVLGTLELVQGGRWRQDVVAEDAVQVLPLPLGRLDALRRRYPALDRALRDDAERRQVGLLLATCTLFHALPAADRERLAARFHPIQLSEGEVLVHEGRTPSGLFLVAGGRVDLLRRGEYVGCVLPGDCVGVLAAMSGGPAAATAVAGVATEVFELDAEEVSALVEHPFLRDAFGAAAQARLGMLTG